MLTAPSLDQCSVTHYPPFQRNRVTKLRLNDALHDMDVKPRGSLVGTLVVSSAWAQVKNGTQPRRIVARAYTEKRVKEHLKETHYANNHSPTNPNH